MPELPDITLYVNRLSEKLVSQKVEAFRVFSPFVLRSTSVAPSALIGATLQSVSRIGKRIVFHFDEDHFLVVHLMIAGRFQWREPQPQLIKPSKIELFRITWTSGILSLNEASPKKRAGIWIGRGPEELSHHRRGGLDVLTTDLAHFQQRLQAGNHTVKRVLTDPATFDGIGNAYSDEILFAAKLSPLKLTRSLEPDEIERLFTATRQVLTDWISRLDQDVKGFPKSSDITAFRPEFFVHGKYRELCRVCNSPIQRIAGSENEMNYCATCQNGGRIFADRSLSRLLKDDWPKTIEQLMAEP